MSNSPSGGERDIAFRRTVVYLDASLVEIQLRRFFLIFAILYCIAPTRAEAQAGPQSGGHEWQIWAGGGHGTNGSQSDDGIFNVGGRFGWILTEPHGPGALRGQFEYAVDLLPVFLITQRAGTAYGFGIDPLALKWNFVSPRSVVPYVELTGGTLFTNVDVPTGTSRVNFTSGGAAGLHFLRRKFNWAAEVRFMHISNAGLASPNPGINTVQGRISIGIFTRAR